MAGPCTPLPSEAEAALGQVEALLRAQSRALLAGDADALPALAAALRPALAALARQSQHELTPALRARVQALAREAAAAALMAGRRGQSVQAALDALGAGEQRLQAARLADVYGRSGGLSSGWRSTGFERA